MIGMSLGFRDKPGLSVRRQSVRAATVAATLSGSSLSTGEPGGAAREWRACARMRAVATRLG